SNVYIFLSRPFDFTVGQLIGESNLGKAIPLTGRTGTEVMPWSRFLHQEAKQGDQISSLPFAHSRRCQCPGANIGIWYCVAVLAVVRSHDDRIIILRSRPGKAGFIALIRRALKRSTPLLSIDYT